MRRLLGILVTGGMLLTGVAFAGTAKSEKAKAQGLVCPVMGTKMASVKEAKGGKYTYKGKTYYFCCSQCLPKFKKDPEKYIEKAEKETKIQKLSKKAEKEAKAQKSSKEEKHEEHKGH